MSTSRTVETPEVMKQPSEKFDVGADFTDDLAAGETITLLSSSVSATDRDEHDVTDTIIVAASLALTGNILSAWVQGGTMAGVWYKVSFTAVTSEGRTFERDVKLVMFD